MSTERRALAFALGVIPFIVLAALNAGGYRYGASDQAFYQPAVLKQLDPELFPRDTIVLAAQARLTAADEVIALVVRTTGMSVPAAFAALYALSLTLFASAAWRIGLHLYRSRWTAAAFLVALTLRHGIARSGTNTLEGYFQPRLLAYALGALAIAAFLRGRLVAVTVLLVTAAAVHPTTAVWFAVWLGVASAIAYPRRRPRLAAAALVAAGALVWALTAGPLAGRLGIMDPEWRQLLSTKNYLFPLEWPAYAWAVNLGYLPVIVWLYRVRRRAALIAPNEQALVIGSFTLALVFAAALVCQAIGIALAFQLQPARVFWMFDFLATGYAVWAVAEYRPGARIRAVAGDLIDRPVTAVAPPWTDGRRVRLAFAALLCLSLARGLYVIVEADRPALQWSIPDDDWGRVMAWARTTDKRSGWLADPMHAVLYGSAVRVAGERDVLVEEVKDVAIGMYDRRIAVRTDERLRAVPDFARLTPARARALGAAYGLDFLVTEQVLPLPLAFESGPLKVYRLE